MTHTTHQLRTLSLLLITVLLLTGFATACGNTSPATSPGTAPATESVETAPAEAPAETGTLSLWTWKVAMTPGFKLAGEEFAKEHGFTLEVEAYSPDDTYRQKILSAANSGDLPDLIHWWATRGVGFENVLVNFKDKVNDEYKAKFAATAFDESYVREQDVRNWASDSEKDDVVKSLQIGDLYNIPLDVGAFFTIYGNNDILSQVALDNKVPSNYNEFIDFAAKAATETEQGGFVFAGGLADVYYNWMGRAVEASFLGAETSVQLINREATMVDSKNIQPLKAFEALATSGAILDGAIAMDIDQADMAFASGEAAYLLGGTFTYGQLNAMGMDISTVFSFPVPLLEGSAIPGEFPINPFTLTGMMIPQSSAHQDKAWEYIEYITQDPTGTSIFANNAYILPAGALSAETLEKLDPAIRSMYDSLSDDINVTTQVDKDPTSIGRKKEWEEMYKDMQKIITGELTAEQVAANFDANAQAQKAAGQ